MAKGLSTTIPIVRTKGERIHSSHSIKEAITRLNVNGKGIFEVSESQKAKENTSEN